MTPLRKSLEGLFITWCFENLSDDENDFAYAGGVKGPELTSKGKKIFTQLESLITQEMNKGAEENEYVNRLKYVAKLKRDAVAGELEEVIKEFNKTFITTDVYKTQSFREYLDDRLKKLRGE